MITAKRVLMIVGFLLLTSTMVFGQATAVYRRGVYVDQYKIEDIGNASGFDNYIVYIAAQISELTIQISGVNYRTISETMGCLNDPDEPCPTVETAPVLFFLNGILLANNDTLGADLTDLQEKKIYLAFWYEYKMKKVATDALAEMELEGMNDLQMRRALKYIYFGHGIDLTIAQSIANDRVTNSNIATYNDLGLATIPLQDRRLLKLFGEVGWFE